MRRHLLVRDVFESMRTSHAADFDLLRQVRRKPERAKFPGFPRSPNFRRGGFMLRWALIFLVIAIIAGVLGFAGIMVAAAGIAKLLFYVFVALFIISLVMGLMTRA
jgi:uncharacterized membrane protein YtjA (UPF0391 family)